MHKSRLIYWKNEPRNFSHYFKATASRQAKKDNTRTFAHEDNSNNSKVIGFYTLTMTPIEWQNLPENLQKKHPSSTSGGLIARLGVDKQYKGQGFGEWSLIDALGKLLSASDSVAFSVIIIEAKDGSKLFYEKYGFTAFKNNESKLFITLADVRASLSGLQI